jgi:hypothetical protein
VARQTSYGYRPPGRQNGLRTGKWDAAVLVGGGLLAGAFAVGLAALLGMWTDTGTDTGATAAALDQGFSELLGAAVGLAGGTAGVALAVRRGPPLNSGLLAGLLGFTCVLGPVFVLTAPSDVSTGEALYTALFLALLLLPTVFVGAMLGVLIRSRLRKASVGR